MPKAVVIVAAVVAAAAGAVACSMGSGVTARMVACAGTADLSKVDRELVAEVIGLSIGRDRGGWGDWMSGGGGAGWCDQSITEEFSGRVTGNSSIDSPRQHVHPIVRPHAL